MNNIKVGVARRLRGKGGRGGGYRLTGKQILSEGYLIVYTCMGN